MTFGLERGEGRCGVSLGAVGDDGIYRINKTLHVLLDCNELHIAVKLLTVSCVLCVCFVHTDGCMLSGDL